MDFRFLFFSYVEIRNSGISGISSSHYYLKKNVLASASHLIIKPKLRRKNILEEILFLFRWNFDFS